jgi:hypothetical protein
MPPIRQNLRLFTSAIPYSNYYHINKLPLLTPITFIMPLVVPGITTKGGESLEQEWATKLMGKKIGEKHDEVVSKHPALPLSNRVLLDRG